MKYIENLPLLTEVDFCVNPLQSCKFYRLQCLFHMPQLRMLDGVQITSEDKVKAENMIEVPYKYCEDLFAGNSTVDCRRWDTGADDYEILNTIIERYKSYYVLDSFRRGKLSFGLWLWPLISRTLSRYFDRALKHYQYWLLKASNRGVGWYNSDYAGLSASIAAQEDVCLTKLLSMHLNNGATHLSLLMVNQLKPKIIPSSLTSTCQKGLSWNTWQAMEIVTDQS